MPGVPGPDVQAALERHSGPVRPLAAAGSPARSAAAERLDESRPHRHVVDPETGGLVSVAGARGTVPAVGALGPVHVDPLPAGVSLSDPTDTASLLERAGARQAAVADAGQPITSGASAPIGTPGISSLDEHVAPSCSGTGTDGSRVQVLYVHDADTPSRLDDVRTVLLDEVANVDDVFAVSSEQTGGGRRVRWVHDTDCLPVIEDVTVPSGTTGSDFWVTVNAVQQAGYDSADRKYLMFTDANQLCGIGTLYDDARLSGNYNDGFAASYARVDAACWTSSSSVAAHELTHTLGGVQSTAPHATSNGHCYDEADIMCYDDGSGVPMQAICPPAQEQLLDCNHDDYFSTAPAPGSYLASSWNTASSSFLDTVAAQPLPPEVDLQSSRSSAETGDTVSFTATSPRTVTWSWSTPSGCTLTPGISGHADMVCPATATGPVPVTATATNVATGGVGSATTTVDVTLAAGPDASVSVPPTATAGTAFPVSVAASGTGPYTYAWDVGGACSVAASGDAATTVSCPADAPSQILAITAAVTQRDGQVVRRTGYVSLEGAGPAPVRVESDWTNPKAHKGTFTANLRDQATRRPLSGEPVVLQVQWESADGWVDLEHLVTDVDGDAVGQVAFPTAGSFRLVFDGDVEHAPSTSKETSVRATRG